MYTYRPKRINNAHIILPVLLLVMAGVSLVGAEIGSAVPPAAMQLAAVAMAAVAIHIINRYSLTVYTYTADNEKKTLSVYKAVGKKSLRAAELEYKNIKHIDKKTKDYSPKKKYGRTYRIYNMVYNVFPRDAYYLICNVDGEDLAVIIEADDILLSHITNKTEVNE